MPLFNYYKYDEAPPCFIMSSIAFSSRYSFSRDGIFDTKQEPSIEMIYVANPNINVAQDRSFSLRHTAFQITVPSKTHLLM